MIAATPALHLLVALSMAAPAGTTACAADDLHCSAPAFAAKARRAESDVERVEYLYFANRAYLALAEQPPTGHVPSRDLCQAKQLIEQALALPATQLRGRVVESRRETLARLTEHKVRCKKSKPVQKDDPAVALADDARADADPPAKLLASTPAPSPEMPAVSSGEPKTAAPPPVVAAEKLTQRPVPETSASPTGPVDAPTQRTASESLTRWDSPPGRPPGRRLLIAGGVSLAAGLALTGVAAYTGAQALGARRTGHESMQLEATPENLTRNMSLEDEYRRLGPVAVVTGVAGGAAVVAAIVMLCVGARRKARAADSEPILMPVRTGLLFTIKF